MSRFLFLSSTFCLSLALCLSFVAGPVLAQAQSPLDAAGQAGFGTTSQNAKKPGQVLGNIITAFLAFVGTIAFVVFLYGGFLWLSARGNSEQVEEAKKYLFNGTMGIAVIILAYAATFYITSQLYEAASTPIQRR